MNNLTLRALTALVAGSATIFAIVFSVYGLWLFSMLVAVLGLWEFLNVTDIKAKRSLITAMGFGILIWFAALWQISGNFLSTPMPSNLYLLIAILIFPVLELVVLFDSSEKLPIQKVSTLSIGFIYCFLPFFLLFQLAVLNGVENYDFRLPLGILLLTWILDTGAYFVGKMMGKHPLFARISPKKTWEGSIGGGLLCIGLGVLFQLYIPHNGQNDFNWIIVAAIIAIFSQFGDLVESMYKRSLKLKDSGTILPGHGGILDRFDGVYLSMPFIYFYYSVL